MKSGLTLLLLAFFIPGAAQEEKDHTKLPPFDMLPRVGEAPKYIFQLESLTEYWVFDSTGTEVLTGVAEFIDMSALKKGDYFIKYYDKVEKCTKSTDRVEERSSQSPGYK